ncbi:MAG: hypothetical protein V4543_11690 [Bacteroidota bacterium]
MASIEKAITTSVAEGGSHRPAVSNLTTLLTMAGSLIGVWVTLNNRLAVLEYRQEQDEAFKTELRAERRELQNMLEKQLGDVRSELRQNSMDIQELKALNREVLKGQRR